LIAYWLAEPRSIQKRNPVENARPGACVAFMRNEIVRCALQSPLTVRETEVI
jgi:hypothetical protein